MRAVDLFSGCGGFTIGAELAGVRVVWAGNHWLKAVEVHELNHPHVLHLCQDLHQADWSLLPSYELLLASPACQGHSSAAQPARKAGGRVKSFHDAYRASAWAVVDCVEVTRPKALIVENVPEFRRWALYPRWRACLQDLGYLLQEKRIVASHLGVPQRRSRLFVVGTRCTVDLELPFSEEPGFGPCVDWDAGEWRPVRGASEAVQARIRSGRQHGDRFLTQHVTGHKGVPLHEPIRTITTKDQWAVVKGDLYRPLTILENQRAMGFPDEYRWPPGWTRRTKITGLGNAVCPPAARALIERVVEVA